MSDEVDLCYRCPNLNLRSGTGPTNKRSALTISAMADEWKEELLCPKCRKTGMVSLYQRRDFEPPTVESLPHGFKIVDTHFGSVFYCEDCDIEVMP